MKRINIIKIKKNNCGIRIFVMKLNNNTRELDEGDSHTKYITVKYIQSV